MWMGCTHNQLHFTSLEQVQKMHRLNTTKLTKVQFLLTAEMENRVSVIATLEQKINKL
jgi:hypothetical protein